MSTRSRSQLLSSLSLSFTGAYIGASLVHWLGAFDLIGFILLFAAFACSLLDWRTGHVGIKADAQDRLDALRFRGLYPREGEGNDEDVRRLKQAGEGFFAIRLFRELHGGTLGEAKRAVDGLR